MSSLRPKNSKPSDYIMAVRGKVIYVNMLVYDEYHPDVKKRSRKINSNKK